MSAKPNLTKRHQSILKATIEHYIATAEPVGSKVIAQGYNLNVSSSTIRNVMGRLEAAGLLYQPHTSAGRIPSDFGYRLYVDRLLIHNETIAKKLEQSLQQKLPKEKVSSFETLIQRSTKILSALSGYIALITFPQSPSDTLRHIQLVQVASGQIMLILVTDSYQTESILIESSSFIAEQDQLDDEMITEELQILSNFLNHKLKGKALSAIASLNWQEIDREFEHYTDFLQILSQKINSHLKPSDDKPIVVHGIAEALRQPEFSQLKQVQTLLYLLEEEQKQLWSVIFALPDHEHTDKKITIKIGAENPLEPMRACTLISANYCIDDTPVGSVGVIGPTRMLYDNTITLVETTAEYLSDAFK
ncbi:heat-inducible transcription repressor HrcA [Xenococcus sp. PCC 7305]|uniref:heat-inducible transcriptional repressor HrcA n=1 Tax=Xenococcus sp. PCC 7305 TaxID=102125 RepID=UPI0002ABFACC|nr:heat-inducible transcriptional repressor HrcA [Xenococcus sp. PCC 7305]ELS04210.1 heat-inducible transcription repressor HrcA [Xenococcus sp. PCC 7305]